MSHSGDPISGRSRLGELALWTTAAVLTLSVHAGAAYYLMQEPPEPASDGGPPAAMMIELAALPEAADTSETVEANDVEDTQEVKSVVPEKIEETPPEEPQPAPEPVVEETPPEPTPEPPPEVVEPLPEELPEPVEQIDPIQQQQMAALENVEVPLPVLRPPPPPVEKKVEKKEEPEKKKTVERKPTQNSAASEARDTAKVETTQSNRTAASRNSSGFFSSSPSPAKWSSRIRAQIERKKPRNIRGNGTSVRVSFKVSDSGKLSAIRLLGSTGDADMDQKVIAWIERASPVAAPPPEVSGGNVVLPVEID